MKKHNQKGFGLVEALLITIAAGIVGFGGYYVWHIQHKNSTTSTSTPSKSPSTSATMPTSVPAQSTQKFLTINEWGVRLKLNDTISDAYYFIPENGKFVSLSVRSLNNTDCKATAETDNDVGVLKYPGIAAIGTFKAGETSPIEGDYRTAYPKSPLIDDKYYYVTGNQYDCTKGSAYDLYQKVRKAFIEASIEKAPS